MNVTSMILSRSAGETEFRILEPHNEENAREAMKILSGTLSAMGIAHSDPVARTSPSRHREFSMELKINGTMLSDEQLQTIITKMESKLNSQEAVRFVNLHHTNNKITYPSMVNLNELDPEKMARDNMSVVVQTANLGSVPNIFCNNVHGCILIPPELSPSSSPSPVPQSSVSSPIPANNRGNERAVKDADSNKDGLLDNKELQELSNTMKTMLSVYNHQNKAGSGIILPSGEQVFVGETQEIKFAGDVPQGVSTISPSSASNKSPSNARQRGQ